MEMHPEIAAALRPEERVVWSGRPRQGLRFHWVDYLDIPLTVAFSSVLVWMAIGGDSALPPTVGLIFVIAAALSLYRSWSRIVWDSSRRGRTFYALTDQRAFILEEGPRRRLQSIVLKDLSHLSYSEHRDGSGSVAWGRWMADTAARQRDYAWSFIGRRVPYPTFEEIPDVRRVYQLAQEARLSTRDQRGPGT